MARGTRYVFVFLLTCGIFAISWYVSSYFNQRKLSQIRDIQNQISTDILSSETQFQLLGELSCAEIRQTPILSDEIATLASKISHSEANVGENEEFALLKKQYSILQVKDFLLSNRIGERCGNKPTTVLYFYDTKEACEDCVRQGYVLDAIREAYPSIRIYSFDYQLDLSIIRALTTIYKVGGTLPSLVINGKTHAGFRGLEEMKTLLPKELLKTEAQKSTPAKAN